MSKDNMKKVMNAIEKKYGEITITTLYLTEEEEKELRNFAKTHGYKLRVGTLPVIQGHGGETLITCTKLET